MDLSRLIEQLKTDLTLTEATATSHQHIVRFASAADYALARKMLRDLISTDRHLIQAVPIIQGFVCTVRHPQRWRDLLGMTIEPNEQVRVQLISSMIPIYAEHPTYKQTKTSIPWGIAKIKANKLWKQTEGENIRIGVIDTGVDFHHPDLSRSLGTGVNVIHRWLPPFDDNGHGTHIAGTIAANNNRNGLVGVAPRSIVFPVKAFDRKGTAYVSEIIQGLEWCVQHRMHIINMSFGMDGPSTALYKAVLKARKAGIIIVASAGNDGTKNKIDFPARYKETIAIGATNKKGRIAKFSNRSRDIHLFAPGHKIPSTWPRGQYRELSGSSMATAHVSGTIALLLARRPRLQPKQIEAILMRAAKPLHYKRKSIRLRELHAYAAFRLMNRLFRKRKKRKKPKPTQKRRPRPIKRRAR